MYHSESTKIFYALEKILDELEGETTFTIGDTSIEVTGKDGLGGLIEEWVGIWALKNGFKISDPEDSGGSQEFPDYYVGEDKGLLEIKCFDSSASPNFDLANFDSYCESVANMPYRVNSDYLIFSYKLDGSHLSIQEIWLKKIWEISCPSGKYPLKTQNKKGVIYNIRPATWYSTSAQYEVFENKEEFIEALFETQQMYKGENSKDVYLSNLKKGL